MKLEYYMDNYGNLQYSCSHCGICTENLQCVNCGFEEEVLKCEHTSWICAYVETVDGEKHVGYDASIQIGEDGWAICEDCYEKMRKD